VKKPLLPAFPTWLSDRQALRSPVLSTRIRLARNFADVRFPLQAPGPELERVLARVERWVREHPGLSLNFIRLRDLSEVLRGQLAERGLVHMESAAHPDRVGLALGSATASLLVNEEDHLRLQVLLGGLNLNRALDLARRLDERLAQDLPLAVHPQFGFLTACPTNVGTGLRASVMLHLPALALTRGIVQVLQAVLHMGLAVRGIYGEGTELRTVFFQISNQVTLGRDEEEIVAHLEGVTRQIVERETEARVKLLTESRHLLEDKVGRALGTLAGSRLVGLEEGLDLLSSVHLGVDSGLLSGIRAETLNQLLLQIQPAHLQAGAPASLTVEDQSIRRADLIRRRLRVKPVTLGTKTRRMARKRARRSKTHVR